jgi:hypothetical protein
MREGCTSPFGQAVAWAVDGYIPRAPAHFLPNAASVWTERETSVTTPLYLRAVNAACA